jgi:hypothetical protein
MKKIFVFGFILVMFSVAASAQTGPGYRDRQRHGRELTRGERTDLRRDNYRLGMSERRAMRDGYVSPRERMQIGREKHELRREAFRYRHNRNHRHYNRRVI